MKGQKKTNRSKTSFVDQSDIIFHFCSDHGIFSENFASFLNNKFSLNFLFVLLKKFVETLFFSDFYLTIHYRLYFAM